MTSDARAARETRTKTLALAADAALEEFVKSNGYVQVSSALTASVASFTMTRIILLSPSK